MVQTIQPGERESDRAADRRVANRRVESAEPADIDGVLYRLGRLQRVLVDVRAQVRELRTYVSCSRVDEATLSEAAVDDLRRRLVRVGDALDAMRDDYDLARDAVETVLDAAEGPDATVIALHDRSLPAGA